MRYNLTRAERYRKRQRKQQQRDSLRRYRASVSVLATDWDDFIKKSISSIYGVPIQVFIEKPQSSYLAAIEQEKVWGFR